MGCGLGTSSCPETTADAIVCPLNYEDVAGINVTFGAHFNDSGLCGSGLDVIYDQWLMDTGFVSPDDWAIALEMHDIFQFNKEVSGFNIEAEGDCVTTECDLFWGFGNGQKYITFHHDFDGHSWATNENDTGIWISSDYRFF